MKKWKKLSEQYLLKREPWLVIREDKLEMPNGTIMDSYYVFEYPDWVNVIAIDKQGHMIMIEQYRHALGRISIELSAGVCDADDADFLSSAKRELLEETGYGGGKWEYWMVNSANPGTHTNLTHCFIATEVELLGNQHLDKTEDIQVHVMTQEQVLSLLLNNQIDQSLHAAALWKYFALHKP